VGTEIMESIVMYDLRTWKCRSRVFNRIMTFSLSPDRMVTIEVW